MLGALRGLLLRIVDDIDGGDCHLSEAEMEEVIESLRRYIRDGRPVSKYEACRMLGISRATFDRKVSEGVIPQGRKAAGFKELFWRRDEIEAALRRATKEGRWRS